MLEIFWRTRMEKLIGAMTNHYIVCGAGRIGFHVIREFVQTGRLVAAIDIDDRVIAHLRKTSLDSLIHGDGINNDILSKAG